MGAVIKRTLTSLSILALTFASTGCANPCGEVEDRCDNCHGSHGQACSMAAEILSDDGCETLLDDPSFNADCPE